MIHAFTVAWICERKNRPGVVSLYASAAQVLEPAYRPLSQFSGNLSGTKMSCKTKKFGPARRKTTFPSSSPTCPARESSHKARKLNDTDTPTGACWERAAGGHATAALPRSDELASLHSKTGHQRLFAFELRGCGDAARARISAREL
jgi:hypothetical protein